MTVIQLTNKTTKRGIGSLECRVRDLGRLEVEPACEDRGLVAVVAEPRHLPEPEVPFEEKDALVVEAVLDLTSLDPYPVPPEEVLRDLLDAALPIGEHVEVE